MFTEGMFKEDIMVTGKEELLEALIEAFIMEKGTHIFYETAAQKTVNKDAKEAFSTIAKWERKHMDYIQFLYQSFVEDRDVVSFDAFKEKVPAPAVEGGIPVKDMEDKLKAYADINDASALDLALEIEEKSCALYTRLSETAADSNTRVFMKDMIEQEHKHIKYLKDLRIKLAKTP